MKVHYRSVSGRLVFELEAGSQKDLFEAIATTQEVFEADSECGMCHNKDIRFRVREVTKGPKTFRYYEYRCTNPECNAQLAFGQSQDATTLFPKRKAAAEDGGQWLPNRGWFRWSPKDE